MINCNNSELGYINSIDSYAAAMEEYWLKMCTKANELWYCSNINTKEAIAIRDYIDDQVFEKFGIIGHSPILDIGLDYFGNIVLDIESPDYKQLIQNQKWRFCKIGNEDTIE